MPAKKSRGKKDSLSQSSTKSNSSKLAGLTFPVGRIARMMTDRVKKEGHVKRITSSASIYLASSL